MTFETLLQCAVGLGSMFFAYLGGLVRYGTVPIPKARRAIIFVCGLVILAHGLWRLLL